MSRDLKDKMLFSKRLKYFLAGRKITPWGKRIGLNSALTTRMNANNPPGYEILDLISCVENVSVTWLLSGNGSPFNTQNFQSDTSLSYSIAEFCSLGRWDIYLLFDRVNTIIILSDSTAEYDFKGKSFSYRAIKVLIGPMGQQSINTLLQMTSESHSLNGCFITPDNYKQLFEGHVGTYKLFGDEQTEGMISSSVKIDSVESINEFVLTKNGNNTEINYDIFNKILLLVEIIADEKPKLVSPEAKSNVIVLAYRRAIFTGVTSDKIDKFMVQSLFDGE